MKNPYLFRHGEEFDPTSPDFIASIEEAFRAGGTADSAWDFDDDEDQEINEVLAFAREQHRRERVEGNRKFNLIPIYTSELFCEAQL
jgi:hypothetical protein